MYAVAERCQAGQYSWPYLFKAALAGLLFSLSVPVHADYVFTPVGGVGAIGPLLDLYCCITPQASLNDKGHVAVGDTTDRFFRRSIFITDSISAPKLIQNLIIPPP